MQPFPTNRNPALENDIPPDPALTEFDEEAASFSLGNTFHRNVYPGFDSGQHWLPWDASVGSSTWVQQPILSSAGQPYPQPYQQQHHVQQPMYAPQYSPSYSPPINNNAHQYYRHNGDETYAVPQQSQHYLHADVTHNLPYEMQAPGSHVNHNIDASSHQDMPNRHVYASPTHFEQQNSQYSTPGTHFPALPIRHQTPSGTFNSATLDPESAIFINTFIEPTDSIHSRPLTLNWSPKSADECTTLGDLTPTLSASSSKRKFTSSPSPVIKQEPKAAKQPSQPKGMSDFLVVFENSPGALATVKKRKKLDEPVRKAAKDVRKAGACHQCRFRKRTCGTGTPCSTCLKQGSNLCKLRCQRESPFIGQLMSRYFEHSSNRRVVSFDIGYSSDSSSGVFEMIDIDGIGRLSHPLKMRAQRQKFSDMNLDGQEAVRLTQAPVRGKPQGADLDINSAEIMLLEGGKDIGAEVEQWALEYTSKFIHAAGPDFYSTTMAQIVGTAYVKKGLPETPLVASMLRVASLSFVLRAGVKYTTSSSTVPSSPFRTIQARIDSILYTRLKIAERDLFGRLQILIFRTAGCLGKDQLYPVALVMFQLMRMLSLGASHLSNIVERFNSSVTSPADHINHCQRLLLSVHLALFRSSTPLLLDFRSPSSPSPSPSTSSTSSTESPPPESSKNMNAKQPDGQRTAPNFNRALLNDDDEMCRLAMKMRKVILDFRKKGVRKEMKGSIAWRPEVWELFRGVYDGL